jgi:squalene cyclase
MPIEIEACKSMAISQNRIRDAVNVMLSYQNADGGWPSYENMRAGAWMETLNPASCFGI